MQAFRHQAHSEQPGLVERDRSLGHHGLLDRDHRSSRGDLDSLKVGGLGQHSPGDRRAREPGEAA
jgi:hypothetical protein